MQLLPEGESRRIGGEGSLLPTVQSFPRQDKKNHPERSKGRRQRTVGCFRVCSPSHKDVGREHPRMVVLHRSSRT
jgi:hypothetical protein